MGFEVLVEKSDFQNGRAIMRKLATTLLLSATAACSLAAVAGTEADGNEVQTSNVEITWEDPKSYTDVRPSNESRVRFRNRVMRELGEYFEELAESLSEGQQLSINVTNVDLAGHVWPTFGGGAVDIRIIRDLDIPRMTFSYSLSENNEVIKTADVSLKDMAFMNRATNIRHNDALRYEKVMLKRWF